MQSLFRKKSKAVKIVDGAFNKSLRNKCRFVNGWFCIVCNGLTEHSKMDGAQVCSVCRTAKVPTVHSAQFVEQQKFLSTIYFYSAKIEFEAIISEVCDDRNTSWWLMVKGQLSSHKKYDEAIKMHELRKQQNLEAGRC
jgi:hypothetical protein